MTATSAVPPASRSAAVRRLSPWVLLFLVVAAGLAVPFCRRHHSDWEEVYLTASRRLSAGEDVFKFEHAYLYPPLFAWLATPLAALPPLAGRIAWYIINLAAAAVVLRGAWSLSGGTSRRADEPAPAGREHLIAVLGLLAGIYYLFDVFTNQQTDLVIAALLIVGCLALSAGRAFGAATLLGIGAAMKLTPLLWAPYLMWRRRYLAGVWVAVLGVGLNFLPDLTSRPPGGGTQLGCWAARYLRPMAERDYDPGRWGSAIICNHSLGGVCNRWLIARRVPGPTGAEVEPRPDRMSAVALKIIVVSLAAGLVGLALFAVGRRPRPGAAAPAGDRLALEMSLVFTLMLILSPQSSKAHFCTLLLPGFCLARAAVVRREVPAAVFLGAAIAAGLLSNKDLWGGAIYTETMWYGAVFWNALSLLLGCAVTLIRQRRAEAVGAGPAEVPTRLAA